MPNEIPVVFHKGSIYDYHFIIKELAKEFEGQFECLRKNTEKYKSFSVLIEKEVTENDKDGNKIVVTISYKIKLTDSARFMATSLSNLADNLIIHKMKCKDCDCFLEYECVNDNLIKLKCLSCNRDYSSKLDRKWKNWFRSPFKFSNNEINKSILLLRESVCPYEYINEWVKFNETSLPEKEEICSNLNMKDITDTITCMQNQFLKTLK